MNPFETHGAFSWAELMTPDPATASDFYAKLLGWSYEKMDMATGPYTVAKVGEWPVAGIMAPPDEGVPTVWSIYVTVDDVNLIASNAVELGGKRVNRGKRLRYRSGSRVDQSYEQVESSDSTK